MAMKVKSLKRAREGSDLESYKYESLMDKMGDCDVPVVAILLCEQLLAQ